MSKIKFKEVSFETMLKCDGEIICDHWLLNNKYRTGNKDLRQPIMFNDLLREIGIYLTSMNCKSLLKNAKWYVIDDGIQTEL